MDRLFLDANVLFSAAYREGAGIARLWDLSAVALCSSTYAVMEARKNLPQDDQVERLDRLLRGVEIVDAVLLPQGCEHGDLPDKDRPILAGALAAKATHLITGDVRHFGKVFGATLEGILVLPPARYLSSR